MKINLKNLKKRLNLKYYNFLKKNTFIKILFGGSSSGKSYGIAQSLVIDLLRGRQYLVIRKTKVSLSRSVFNEVTEKIQDMGLSSLFRITPSRLEITCTVNGCQALFAGCDDPEKIKSIKPKRGVLTDIWIEEATELTYTDFKQLTKRLRGLTPHKKRILLSFNPILKTHWIFQHFFKAINWQDSDVARETESIAILKTTYKDNQWLTADDIVNLESETDPYYRSVYLDGNWGTLAETIFKNFRVEEFDRSTIKNHAYGNDFGFSTDPLAVVDVGWNDLRQRKLYICRCIYEKHLLNNQAIPLIKEMMPSENTLMCDAAEPKSIEEYIVNGILAKAAKKGPGSVQQGIKFLQQFEIIIHPDCMPVFNEFSTYHFRKDANGNIMPEPVDADNHAIDAIRYAVEPYMGDNLLVAPPPFSKLVLVPEDGENTISNAAACLIYQAKDNSKVHLLFYSAGKVLPFSFGGTWDVNLHNLETLFKVIRIENLFCYSTMGDDMVYKMQSIGIPAAQAPEFNKSLSGNAAVFNTLKLIVPTLLKDNSVFYSNLLKNYEFNGQNEDIPHSFGMLLYLAGLIND